MLSKYPNLAIRQIGDFKERLKGLPVIELWDREKRNFEDGPNYFEQVSDVIRAYLLYKYGGIYLDIDAVSMRNIPETISDGTKFPQNFGVAIYYGNVNGAVMRFRKGHPFLMKFMELMVRTHHCMLSFKKEVDKIFAGKIPNKRRASVHRATTFKADLFRVLSGDLLCAEGSGEDV